ncbi:hypothetical protein [Frondihabitans australicus]|uniref:Uncharacterized protein n=1 Tax=Frondihabitans australicus TaxID=386892 RepID=A0A495IK32_9MICO|nr:hypothetical protein [Frondihabitans australicus]RKR76334.1 hypothetical protein C8E83_3503 [Frondihabitans australicus]
MSTTQYPTGSVNALRPLGVQIVTAPRAGEAAAWWLAQAGLSIGMIQFRGDLTVLRLSSGRGTRRRVRLIVIGGPGAFEYVDRASDEAVSSAFATADPPRPAPPTGKELFGLIHPATSVTCVEDPWRNAVFCRRLRGRLVPCIA